MCERITANATRKATATTPLPILSWDVFRHSGGITMNKRNAETPKSRNLNRNFEAPYSLKDENTNCLDVFSDVFCYAAAASPATGLAHCTTGPSRSTGASFCWTAPSPPSEGAAIVPALT